MLDVIDQGVDAADPRELSKRLDILNRIAGDLSECPGNVIGPSIAAIRNLETAQTAEQGDMLGADYTTRAYVKAQKAREALDATN